MDEPIQVTTTTGDHHSALAIARTLVEDRLAACVQIGGPIESVYRWKGTVQTSQEWTCTIKTTRHLYPRVEQRIRDQHSYEEPEIIATPIVAGSPGYLQWLRGEVSAQQ